MPEDTVLCRKPERVTVADYRALKAAADCQRLSKFILDRLTERYIEPIRAIPTEARNGFATMAVSCLLIEALESFRQGWPSSNGKSQLAFCLFFDREDRFADFRGCAAEFYQDVRCGILHQGETTGGWLIERRGLLFEPTKHAINATKFHRTLQGCVTDYGSELGRCDWDQPIWRRFVTKMDATIKNCA